MSLDHNRIIQANQNLYDASAGNIPTTYIPTSSAGSVGFMVMSYPGRPPMVPGIPPMAPAMAMPYMPIGGPPPLMPAVMPMPPHMLAAPPMPPMPAPPIRTYRPPQQPTVTHHAAPTTVRPSFTKRQSEPSGPPVTVFVGNITERAPDAMIRHILAACGHVVSWKRVQAFGFCEFGSPDAGLRAIRLLHDMEIGGKKLVVKVDAKTKTVLDEYKAEKRKKIKGKSPLQDETPEDEEDYMDETMKQTDKSALESIKLTMEDYETDMNNYAASSAKAERAKAAKNEDRKMSRTQEKLMKLSQGAQDVPNADTPLLLDDVDIEEGKRDLITREIGKFREIMKVKSFPGVILFTSINN